MSAPEPLRTFQTGRQIGIYRAGKRIDPGFIPLAVEDLERKARSLLSAEAYDWIAGSAGGGATARANLAAFERWGIVPRMLCDISSRDFGVSLFGDRLPVPLLVAPIGVQAAAHAEMADRLCHAADAWEAQDAEGAQRLRNVTEGGT